MSDDVGSYCGHDSAYESTVAARDGEHDGTHALPELAADGMGDGFLRSDRVRASALPERANLREAPSKLTPCSFVRHHALVGAFVAFARKLEFNLLGYLHPSVGLAINARMASCREAISRVCKTAGDRASRVFFYLLASNM